MLVGDMDQSIYSFTGAQPDVCNQLVAKCNLVEMPLKQNFRSSQPICRNSCVKGTPAAFLPVAACSICSAVSPSISIR